MVHVRSPSLLDNLTFVALLTINSFPFSFPHKISGGLDILLYMIVISHSVFFSDQLKQMKGNYSTVLINHKNVLYRQKVLSIYLLSMIMNPNNFHFDSVSIFTLSMSKTLDMYMCLILANILNNALSFIFFILGVHYY